MKIIITITTAFWLERNELRVLRGRETKFLFDGIIFQILVESFGIFVNIKYAWKLFEFCIGTVQPQPAKVSERERRKWKNVCAVFRPCVSFCWRQRGEFYTFVGEPMLSTSSSSAVERQIFVCIMWIYYNFFSRSTETEKEPRKWARIEKSIHTHTNTQRSSAKVVLGCLILHITAGKQDHVAPFIRSEYWSVCCIPWTIYSPFIFLHFEMLAHRSHSESRGSLNIGCICARVPIRLVKIR